MKVKNQGAISLTGPLSRNRKLKALKPGDIIKVEVLKNTGPRSALLNLKGNLVNASFTGEVPASRNISLLLESIKNDKLFFKFPESDMKVGDLSSILKYTILAEDDQSLPMGFTNSLKNINSNNFSIMHLSGLLLGIKKDRFGKLAIEKSIDKFLKSVVNSKGGEANLFLSSLLFSPPTPSMTFMIYQLYRFFKGDGKKNDNPYEELSGDKLENDLNEFLESKDFEDALAGLTEEDLLNVTNMLSGIHNSGVKQGVSIIKNEDGTQEYLHYITYEDSFLFSFNLSNTGNVEVLIKGEQITFFIEKDEFYNYLKSVKDRLYDRLVENCGENFYINLKKKDHVFKKVIEINKKLNFNKGLNIQV